MKLLIGLLIISILGNFVGLFVLYKFMQKDKYLQEVMADLEAKNAVIEKISKDLDTRMVFVHHSVGRNWLSEGGLRDSLAARGIAIRSVTRGNPVGDSTDFCHWLPKFKNNLDDIIHFDAPPNQPYAGPEENEIIMFKSCYPNSDIVAEGEEPGDPNVPTATIANYKAVMGKLESIFAEHPNKTFIHVTTPPLAEERTTPENAARARVFNNWVVENLVSEYEKNTGQSNLLVFDLYGVLADEDTNCLRDAFKRRPNDSHPNKAGSRAATKAFMKFLDTHDIKPAAMASL
ncbi:hypothetical protein GF377_05915 [candidate division GN15 bacterium]|nr:hypothetical protein [candidate division GN15 bacterium]